MADRAQSETIGFVLVFALIVTSIGVVYAGGFASLTDVREAERVTNAERAFEVLADNVDDIMKRGAPSRATEIKLADASISAGDPVSITVSVEGTGFNATYDVRPIIFDAGTGTELVYVEGAVIRQQTDSGVVLRGNTLLLNENRSVIPIINTRLVGGSGVSGSTTVLVRTELAGSSVEFSTPTQRTVWVNVTTPRAETWRSHLAGMDDVTCVSVVDSTAACRITTDSVVLVVHRIDLTFD